MDRVFQDFMIYLLGYPALAWMMMAMWWRYKLNDKHNFRKKSPQGTTQEADKPVTSSRYFVA